MLHISTGIHHRTDSAHRSAQHISFPARAVALLVAEGIRDHWFSVVALTFALWAATDLGINAVVVAPPLGVLAVLVNAVLNPAGSEAINAMETVDERA
ncbi:MAG: hypothetical protein HKN03_04615 [Acidimicrobiales bacterium]|nr:hypothetical protein [Acidimicrobiales bacterium]